MPVQLPLYFSKLLFRTFSTARKVAKIPSKAPKIASKAHKIPSKQRHKAMEAAQKALTEYLHSTRSLPFTFAEHISKNSTFSLSQLVSKVNYSSFSSFPNSLQRFFRYHPVNEFEFFYESIGINYADVSRFLHPQKFFISEDSRGFNVACALSGFGFPWNSLGKLYKEEISIFSRGPDEISRVLNGLKDYGFSSMTVTGICLAFPFALGGDPELAGEVDGLSKDLRKLVVDFGLDNSVEDSVQAWFDVCTKVRVFYDLGCQKGKMGELMGKSKHIFLEYQENILVHHSKFFSRLGVDKSNVGLLLLENPEIFEIDLESPIFSVSKILNHLGLDQVELESIAQKYPYVLGRNKMANLPEVMRALNLHGWFFDQMRNGNLSRLKDYVLGSCNEDIDNGYMDFIDIVRSSRNPVHTLSKLEFLHGIGFGENSLSIAALKHLHGTRKELQERFDCLLHAGLFFSKLCMNISSSPKILNQNREHLENKMKFLLENTGSSLDLHNFPAVLCFDLEKRIKPRHKFHWWLVEKGLTAKQYSLASMIATSEKNFIARINKIHPAAVKHWFECFSN